MRIEIDKEAAAVLLRCLAYGENAISTVEHTSGVSEIIANAVRSLRKSIASQLADEIIQDCVENQ